MKVQVTGIIRLMPEANSKANEVQVKTLMDVPTLAEALEKVRAEYGERISVSDLTAEDVGR